MKLVYLTFSKCDDGYAQKFEMLIEGGNISLVPGYTVKRFSKDNIKLAGTRVLHQSLDARSQDYTGTGNACVLISPNDLPALLQGSFTADTELVLYRGFALVVRRIAGVKGNA